MTVGTITVGAANGWNYADMFKQLFGDKTENIIESIIPEAVVLEDNISHMDFEIKAAAADRHSALIILDIYGKNGYKFTEKNLDESKWYFADLNKLNFDISSEDTKIMQYNMSLMEGDENKLRIGITVYAFQELKDCKINICITEMYTKENDDDSFYFSDNRWSAEFVADYSAEEISYAKDICVIGETENGTSALINVDKIEVSPISVCLTAEKDHFFGTTAEFFNVFWSYENVFAVTDSGEKIKILNFGKDHTAHKNSDVLILSFAEPVNPEEINYIDLNGHIIQIK